ncbi:CTP-dependent riboflavin kinase [Candidatus Bathyarchaeota archaeon]|nr:CTP-dependent riboflavin kinase [Candidatus Bathyarchaeota archaeon]
MKTSHIKGKVISGSGEGAKFTELPWVKEQIVEEVGFTPYLGTLNVKVTEPSLLKRLLENAKWIEISPVNGFCRGKIVKAHFMDNLECAIIIPEVGNYPEDVIELIAPINLRKKFKLRDGDTVEVKIPLQ